MPAERDLADYEEDDDPDDDWVACPKCGGSGLCWEGWDCWYCDGLGYLDM